MALTIKVKSVVLCTAPRLSWGMEIICATHSCSRDRACVPSWCKFSLCPAVPWELPSLFAQDASGMNQRTKVPLCFYCSKQRQGTCTAKVSVSFRDFSEWEGENQYQQPWKNFSYWVLLEEEGVEVTQLNCAVRFNLLNEFALQCEAFSFPFCSIFQRHEAICHRSHHRSRTVMWT